MMTKPTRCWIAWVIVLCLIAVGLVWRYQFMAAPAVTLPTPTTDNGLGGGVQVVWQVEHVLDRGAKDWANDDTTETVLFRLQPFLEGMGRSFLNITDGPNDDVSVTGLFFDEVEVSRTSSAATEKARYNLDGELTVRRPDAYPSILRTEDATISYQYGTDENYNTWLWRTNAPADAVITLSREALGIDLGYALPIAISDDGAAIYLRQVVETEAYLNGLWRYETKTGEVTPYPYLAENNVFYFRLNPNLQKLIGVSFVPPESLGEPPHGPSAVHIVDLSTGLGEPLLSLPGFVYENPWLAPDGSNYSYSLVDGGGVWVVPIGTRPANEHLRVSGHLLDWFDNTLVVDRDGELILYDLASGQLQALTRSIGQYQDSDYQTARYLGHVNQ